MRNEELFLSSLIHSMTMPLLTGPVDPPLLPVLFLRVELTGFLETGQNDEVANLAQQPLRCSRVKVSNALKIALYACASEVFLYEK